jgi:hypothetical protein
MRMSDWVAWRQMPPELTNALYGLRPDVNMRRAAAALTLQRRGQD